MDVKLENICVPTILSIKKAVHILNEGHCRIVLVLDDEQKFVGVVTDSDVRKAILNGISFDQPVNRIMTEQPVVATVDMKDNEIFTLMCETKCYEIPVLDSEKRVVGLRMIDGFIGRQQKEEIIIMAGGLGTRLRPLTETRPKPLITVGGKPILFILIDQLILNGFRNITICINYKAEMIRDAVLAVPSYAKLIKFIEEKKRMGTAGSLSLIEHPPKSSFVVMNADLLTRVDLVSMIRFHEKEKNSVTVASSEEVLQVPFGVLKMKEGRVFGIEEKPVQNYLVNAGIYVLEPSVLELMAQERFCDMPDLINDVIVSGGQVGSFPIHEYWLDIGRFDELNKARQNEHLVC